MKKSISLRAWLRRYWVCVLVFSIVLYFLSQSFFLRRITERVEKNLQSNVTIAENYIEDSLEMADNYIYEAYSNSMDMPDSRPFYLLRYGNASCISFGR